MVTTAERVIGFRLGSGGEERFRKRRKKRINQPPAQPAHEPQYPGGCFSESCGVEDNNDPLSWLPLYCDKALRSAVERHELVIFVQTARNDLHRRMESYFTSYKLLQMEYFTIEERNALEIADSLKTGELMGNHRTLKSMEKYLKTGVRAHLMRAREHYRNTEDVWNRLIEHLKEFAMINLLGRRCFSF